jgi:F-type H+-transporting ATPase subunit delta
MMTTSENHQVAYDSGRQQVATIYAKGLIGAAEKQGITPLVMEELNSLVDDVLGGLPTFRDALSYPRIAFEEKQRMLDTAFAGKMNPLLLNFLKVVAQHERLDCLYEIRKAAVSLYNQLHGQVEVEVRTAEPLTAEMLSQVEQQLTASLGKQVDLQTRIDPALMGGMVVRVGDTVYDGSLLSRLEQMRTKTLESTTEKIRDSLERFMVSD